MKAPAMAGVIERRLLVNYRIEPEIAARHLPEPFRPQLVRGSAVAGICLIRLGNLRPVGWPERMGLRSENAAHRIAVAWDTPDGVASGVYIPRRDTDSFVNATVGGRLFPGEHHRAGFEVDEHGDHFAVRYVSRDGRVMVDVQAEVIGSLDGSDLFNDLAAASRFFQSGPLGYSPRHTASDLDGLELETPDWRVEPVLLHAVRSSFFDSSDNFPPGTATLDCALLMRDVAARWLPHAGLAQDALVRS